MDSNNHFNYGTHSSANSGLKLSSGDSLYTNGSSVSFPQQGKNMNGEINVNGTSTVLGSGVPSSHPPTASYPHMSNRHQSSIGYDYLWGGHPQYGPAMSSSAGHGMHQKQPTPGMSQPQSQHHFQGHGQYQLNGGMEGSHQPPGAVPPNMPQYWNRSNPGPQQIGYNSHSIYGAYQSQVHPGIAPSQQHQQQPTPQQHLHPHRSPHLHQQHQQPQHYGMMPNGMPFYQHQPPHPSVSSQQQQQQQQQAAREPQPQGPTQLVPPASSSRGSPQHHSFSRAGSGSPLPVGTSTATVISSTRGQDSESPKSQKRENKMSSVIQANMREPMKEVDASYNGSERAPRPQTENHLSKPPAAQVGPAEQLPAHRAEMAALVQDAAVKLPSQLSTPSSPAASSQTMASVAPTVTGSPNSTLRPPAVSSPGVGSTQSQISAFPSLSSVLSLASPPKHSPLVMQGLKPLPSVITEVAQAGSKNLSARSPVSPMPTSPLKSSTPSTQSKNESRPPSVSVASSLESATHLSALLPAAPGPVPAVSTSAAISSLQQMVQGSNLPCFPKMSGAQHDRPRPPKLISTITSAGSNYSSAARVPSSCASPTSVLVTPPIRNKPAGHVPSLHHQTGVGGDLSAASSPSGQVTMPSLTAHKSPTAQALPTLPLLTTQASRTALLSGPPALVSLPSAMGTTSQVVQCSSLEKHATNTTSCLSVQSGHYSRGEDGITQSSNRSEKAEDRLQDLESLSQTPQKIEVAETRKSLIFCHKSFTDLPGKPLPTTVASDQTAKNKQEDGEDETERSAMETTPFRKSPQLHSPRVEHLTEDSFDRSQLAASQSDDSLTDDTPPRIDASSVFETTPLLDGDSSYVHDSAHFDGRFHPRSETSRLDSSAFADGEASSVFDSTRDSSFSVDESRDDTMDSTRGEETSEAEETRNSHHVGGDSTLSFLDSSAQMEEPSIDASDGSKSCSFKSSQSGPQGAGADWEMEGHANPDLSGQIRIKTTIDEQMPLPTTFNMRDENFIAFSSPEQSLAVHPLQSVSGQIASGRKPRKPRTPKTIWVKTPAPEDPKRRRRAQTPKAEKIESAVDDGKEEVGPGRKRKKSLKVESGDGSQSEAFDSITATIDAVLASASSFQSMSEKIKKVRRTKKQEQDGSEVKTPKQDGDAAADDDGSTAGESNRRRVATEEQVQFAIQHGWRREIRVRKKENRMKGETWYYTPCGRRMKQLPEILKYLNKIKDSVVTREHFSFSPRMPVGDFYEERETPEGMEWVLLADAEVPSMIMAITGRRGRPPNPDKEKPRRPRVVRGGEPRRPGRPPKAKMVDLLSKVDAKLLKRLEAKDTLTEEDKEKLAKIKKKMKKKARLKRREETKIKKMKDVKKKAKLDQQTKGQEVKAEPNNATGPQAAQSPSESAAVPKKPGRRRSAKVAPPPPVQQTDEERIAQGKRVLGARSKAKALAKAQAKAQAEAEAVARAALSAKRAAERRAQAQKRMEERKRQQLIAEELKKPTEDMCLTDHKLLPELSRIPGVVLSGTAFAHCLSVVEFLNAFGKLIGLNVPKDIPSLSTLQEGLLGLGESQGEVQDLLIKLVESALHDPGLPAYYQSVKILGEKLADLELTRSTVSEALRIFLDSHGYEAEVCNALRTKTFHSLPPDAKAAILGFLVDELNGNNIVTRDIDNTLENMATYRKNKWIIEGKLRKLKAALARRTGRSEEELCFEERRRSARVADEENLSLDEGVVTGRGSRRVHKEEPKLCDSESPATASIPELERQIDKLTKRQAFFRKKLLLSSHSMRSVLLGQDRFRRRYLAFPHLGGVLVEGPEELLTSGDVLIAEVPVAFFKEEPKVEEAPLPTSPPDTLPSSPTSAAPALDQSLSAEEDQLPGTASLMSRPRGRGRPRKIKPEVELHLRTAKVRRRRRSSSVRSSGEEGPASPKPCTQDLSQSAFLNWLSQSQDTLANGTCSAVAEGAAAEGDQPDENQKETAEKQGQWFNVLPKQPCDGSSLAEPQTSTPPPSSPSNAPNAPPEAAAPLTQTDPLLPTSVPSDPVTSATPLDNPVTTPDSVTPAPPPPPPAAAPQLLAAPVVPPAPVAPPTPARPTRRRRRGSRGSSPARRGPRGAAAKRRGRPPNTAFQELEQQYFTQLVVKPIPAAMVRGWWWIKDPEELYRTLQALHPRGIRERVLHKHLAKYMESLTEMCTKPINDPIFDMKVEQKDVLVEALQQPWQVQEKAVETDVRALQWVEDLEQRVIAADLQLKALPQSAITDAQSYTETPMAEFQAYVVPDADSTRTDLQYYEHDADPQDDWIVRTKKEWSGLPRIATHPVDLAVLRLANLERNIERRYLKDPLWNLADVIRLAPVSPTPGEEEPMDVFSLENEITSRLRTWRQALDRVRSAPQLCLCLHQLEKSIAWERSVTKVACQVCRKGDNDDCLLLCDGCDRGCHMYCLRPKMTQVPEGDWFCPTCVAKEEGKVQRLSKTRTRVNKRKYEEESSEDEPASRRSAGMATRNKDAAPSSSSSRHSAEGSAAKRRRMTTRNHPDLTFCEIILMEMEAHADAWPFLEPVNPRLVPGYRRIIKTPMDFLTMRERLLQGGYSSCDEFAADAQLVFNNCELFNEDTSEVGSAGHAMRRFFESRWAEFYSNKDK